ncbi:hypothetical protein NECAME_10078 [Necator americanus]|uniref:Uncharacterized protein n=1 Tax=Necator americanus TaxID=51031 RepID=W2TAJ1_NECAM|nr:hypothetical protein NECAME_10078 [Necator americanus]ETN78853.1 hypothetical protein NECAME_10078 [Necator americanus]
MLSKNGNQFGFEERGRGNLKPIKALISRFMRSGCKIQYLRAQDDDHDLQELLKLIFISLLTQSISNEEEYALKRNG